MGLYDNIEILNERPLFMKLGLRPYRENCGTVSTGFSKSFSVYFTNGTTFTNGTEILQFNP